MSGLVYTIADLSQYKENVGAIGNYNNVLVFNMATVEKYTELVGHCSYIWCIIHLADYKNNIIASASQDNTIKLWNLDQNCCEKTLTGHTNWVTTVQLFKLDPKILISASYDHNIKFWNLDSGECMKTIGSVFGKGVLNAYYAREGYIVYGSVGNSLKIYDYLNETEKFSLKGHTNLVNCFANLGIFNPNYIASGSDDKTVKIWNLLTGELVYNLPGHRECINSLTHLNGFNANLLASVSDDRTIRIWNLSRFECVAQLNFHSSWVKSIMHIKSNPEYLYSHGDTGSVVCWKIERCLEIDDA
ncbi:MAG: WD40 repeat domain-containing protein [bacterium]|jgi:WD40 repeat protein